MSVPDPAGRSSLNKSTLLEGGESKELDGHSIDAPIVTHKAGLHGTIDYLSRYYPLGITALRDRYG